MSCLLRESGNCPTAINNCNILTCTRFIQVRECEECHREISVTEYTKNYGNCDCCTDDTLCIVCGQYFPSNMMENEYVCIVCNHQQ